MSEEQQEQIKATPDARVRVAIKTTAKGLVQPEVTVESTLGRFIKITAPAGDIADTTVHDVVDELFAVFLKLEKRAKTEGYTTVTALEAT